MRSLFLAASMLLSVSALADTQIICLGKATESKIQVELSGRFWLIDDAEYSFEDKIIPISLNEASIGTNLETQKQSLVLRFTTSKRHNNLKKNAKLKFTIAQTAPAGTDTSQARVFELSPGYKARLSLEDAGSETLIDSLECQSKTE